MSASIRLTLPAALSGTVSLPASKSISARALVIAALAGDAHLENVSDCDDSQVLKRALEAQAPIIDIHAAGTAMRFSTAFFSVTPGMHVLTGTERMKQRPIALLVDALRSLGADIAYEEEEGFPPLRVTGKTLSGGEISIPADVSSQYVSALLMVAPTMRNGLTLHLVGAVASKPYIDMTIAIMRHFGAEVEWTDSSTISVRPTPYRRGVAYAVEADWSAASYWYELVALSPSPSASIRLPGLIADSLQGDSIARRIFAPLGVATTFTAEGVELRKAAPQGERLTDFANCPDLAQTVAVTLAMMGKPFALSGLKSLKIKETDRLVALCNELAKLGCDVQADECSLRMDALAPISACPQSPAALSACPKSPAALSASPAAPPAIDTYEDHRMAMAFAPCAFRFPGLIINNPHVVVKSYPTFWDDLRSVGASVVEE